MCGGVGKFEMLMRHANTHIEDIVRYMALEYRLKVQDRIINLKVVSRWGYLIHGVGETS